MSYTFLKTKLFECLKEIFGKANEESQPTVESALLKRLQECSKKILKINELIDIFESNAPFVLEGNIYNDSISWTFVLHCSAILIALKSVLDNLGQTQAVNETRIAAAPALLEDMLSIEERQLVLMCVQSILKLGVYPSLIPPIRSSLQGEKTKPEGSTIKDLSNYDSYRRLIFCTSILIYISDSSSLRSAILPHHFLDYLALWAQLCHAPIKKAKISKEYLFSMKRVSLVETILNQPCSHHIYQPFIEPQFGSEDELIVEMWQDRKAVEPHFEILRKVIYPPLLVRDAFVLQGRKTFSPAWLQRFCGNLLTSILLKPKGLQNILEGAMMLESENEENKKTFLHVMSQLLSKPPIQCSSVEEYIEHISPQLLEIISKESVDLNIRRLGFTIIFNLWEIRKDLICNLVFEKILQPFFPITFTAAPSIEMDLSRSVMILDKLLQCGPAIAISFLDTLLIPPFFTLFHLYSFVLGGTSHLTLPTERLLLFILSHSSDSFYLLKYNIFQDTSLPENAKSPVAQLDFKNGQTGGVVIALSQNLRKEEVNLDTLESQSRAVISLISKLQDDKLISQYFIYLLERLSSLSKRPEGRSDDSLQNDLTLMILLQGLVETQSHTLIKDRESVINFIQGMLQRSVLALSGSEVQEELSLANETLFLCLSILDIITSPTEQELERRDWLMLSPCLSSLDLIRMKDHNSTLGQLANHLRLKISSRGTAIDPKFSKTKDSKSEFSLALQDLHDASVPSKGHALIALRRLIQQRDVETLSQRDILFTSIQDELDHEDSYVYLSAIQTLSVLVQSNPDLYLPKLAARFLNSETSIQVRLNLGEAIVLLTKNLGEMAPKYRDILLPIFMRVTKDPDSQIRSSSLSNLGELLKLLRFSIGNNLQEVLGCLSALSSLDPAVEVRRSSVMVLAQLLKGLGKDSLMLLQNELIQVYRKMKQVYNNENDDVTKLHAQLALEEINLFMRDFLNPSSVVKEIRILGPN